MDHDSGHPDVIVTLSTAFIYSCPYGHCTILDELWSAVAAGQVHVSCFPSAVVYATEGALLGSVANESHRSEHEVSLLADSSH